jgi:hypothetical protein
VMMKEWHKEWTKTQTTKVRSYATVQPTLQPLFHTTKYKRTTIITLCRLRFGHNCTPFHLHRIHYTDEPACNCDGISLAGTTHLIIFIYVDFRLDNELPQHNAQNLLNNVCNYSMPFT